KAGSLENAMFRRLDVIYLDPYSVSELKAIIQQAAEADKVSISPQAARLLAEGSRGSPGIAMKRFFGALGNLTKPESAQITQADAEEFLASEAIDPVSGTNAEERRYLRLIYEAPDGRISKSMLVSILKCDQEYVTRHVEPFLFASGLLIVNSKG